MINFDRAVANADPVRDYAFILAVKELEELRARVRHLLSLEETIIRRLDLEPTKGYSDADFRTRFVEEFGE